jgi:23S rRNA (guanosine2251-2'-O)-methyltransferase
MENKTSTVFGIRAIIEAINSGNTISKVYLQKELRGDLISELNGLIKANGISTSNVPVEKLDRLSKYNNHQGAVAQISPIDFYDLDELIASVS